MSNYRDFEAAFRRRDLLILLLNAADFSVNDSLLRMLLRQQGYLLGGDTLRADLEWLVEHGLIKLRALGNLTIATLLERGRDVAEGAEQLEGIARPDPVRS